MKSIKSFIFIIAVFLSASIAIKNSFAIHHSSDIITTTTIFIQYDCVNGSEQEPVLLLDNQGDIIPLTESQAAMQCPDGTSVICSAEYEITTAGGPEQPLKVISGKLQFNPSFPGGINAARDHRVLQIYSCDVD